MISNISIPNPCKQSWRQMAQEENGRHCWHCAKTVVDFSKMTDTEVIDYISLSGSACGRFDQFQLERINDLLIPQSPAIFKWRGFVAAASISLLPTLTTAAKAAVKNGQGLPSSKAKQEVTVADSSITKKINGVVTDGENGQPLAGVSVVIKGTATGTQTATDGRFKLSLYNSDGLLVISSIGYRPVEIPVSHVAHNVDICLVMDNTMLDVVTINRINTVRTTFTLGSVHVVRKIPFYLRWWYWLMHQFHHSICASTPSLSE